MELVSAALVVKLLSGYAATLGGFVVSAAAPALEGFAKERIAALVDAVRKRFSGDAAANDALDRLDKAPEDPRRQGAVEERLDEVLQADPEFAELLTELVEAARTSVSGPVTVENSGATAVGGSVTITAHGDAAGRDVIKKGNVS